MLKSLESPKFVTQAKNSYLKATVEDLMLSTVNEEIESQIIIPTYKPSPITSSIEASNKPKAAQQLVVINDTLSFSDM